VIGIHNHVTLTWESERYFEVTVLVETHLDDVPNFYENPHDEDHESYKKNPINHEFIHPRTGCT
jgi:hypothetical protein